MTTALILAGGLGTRLRSVVSDVPKPMAPVGGRPFLEWLMDYWINQGVSRFILSLGYMSEHFVRHFGSHYHGAVIDYSIENTPLGTGGGLIQGLERVSDDRPILVLNGDTFFGVQLSTLVKFANQQQAHWCLCLSQHRDTNRYLGISLSEQNTITSFNTQQQGQPLTDTPTQDCLINAGVYWVKPSCLKNAYPAGTTISLENQILPDALINNLKVCGMRWDAEFIDIGTPYDYDLAERILVRASR